MQALLANLRTGDVASLQIPEPELRAGGLLVRTAFSAISAGTERAKLEKGKMSLIGKAFARPDLARQVLDFARNEGFKAAYQRVQSRLDTLISLGYSCAGTVLAVGEGVLDFRPGDRVACGGGDYATHSEINFIPQNLVVHVPDSVSLDAASLTTIGAIAVQGLRQSNAVFGETVAVIGAGLVGILTVQLAKAAGCRVIAIDLDVHRAERARLFGAELGLSSGDPNVPLLVREFSKYGADAVIITAASPSAEPLDLAAEIARDRGRIVIVGDVGMGVSRHKVYHKELSITLSRSYGPGRYDPHYEEEGSDYPVGYVRWTERRNMDAFVGLLASGAINVSSLLDLRCPVQDGARAFSMLKTSGVYTVLIEYPASETDKKQESTPVSRTGKPKVASPKNTLRVGCIGAGSFARNIIFPALRNLPGVQLHSVASASGIAAQSARQSFVFAGTLTPSELAQDLDTDAVFILSQHDSHARYVVAALSHHKPVFVEKPLAVNRDQLAEIRAAVSAEREQGRDPFVMVGFNRRFAPLTEDLRRFFHGLDTPMMLHCRVNAGFIPRDHWTQRQGGRIVGEMCHFIDWARAVIGSPIDSVYAKAIPDGSRHSQDNVAVTLSCRNGSVATLLYLANGDKSVPKEYFEVFSGGAVAVLDDFRELRLTRHGKTKRIKSNHDKGHAREIELTAAAMRAGNPPPIPLEEILEVTEASFAALESLGSGQPVLLPLVNHPAQQEIRLFPPEAVGETSSSGQALPQDAD